MNPTLTAPEITVTGILGRDAESRRGTGDTWWLFLEIHQAPDALAIAANKCIGSGVSADLASKDMARRLKRGTPVTVRAARYDIALSPSPHLVLLNVRDVQSRLPAPGHPERHAA